MKRPLILFLIIIQFISCGTNNKELKIEENCYDVLYSVSYVTDVYDKRNIRLSQLFNEIKNNSKIDNDNIKEIEKLSIEIKKRVKTSLNKLNEKYKENKNEKIFEVSLKYLSKVNDLEEKLPSFVKELSDNIPNTNFELKDLIKKYAIEATSLGQTYHIAMNDYYKLHKMSDVKLDSIENVVEEKTKNIKY